MKCMRLKMALLTGLVLVISCGIRAEEAQDTVDYLFVQNSEGLTVKGDSLVLKGVSPTTIYFSDRPERIAGHLSTERFVNSWAKGKDSFKLNNPNAALSVLNGDEMISLVVVLSNPVLKKDKLSYGIRILEGSLPDKSGPCSLFIDVIGVPRSPRSIGGIARRNVRRHVVVGSNLRVAEARADEEDAEEAREVTADKKQTSDAVVKAPHSPEEKLGKLKQLLDEGYITQDDYDKKKAEILKTLK